MTTADTVRPLGSSPDQPSARREQLLQIATQLFAARGYSTTTVRDIADSSGILSGSLYHHFESKEAMFREILRGFLDNLLADFKEIVAQSGGATRALDALVAHAFKTIERVPDTVALYQNEIGFVTHVSGFEFVVNTGAQIERIWIDAIKAGQMSGDFRSDVDVAVVYRFIRDAVWSSVHWFRPGGRHTAESLTAQYLELLHGGLLASGVRP